MVIGGGGAAPGAGALFARYQFSAAVSAPGRDRLAIQRSVSFTFRVHSRNSCQLFSVSCASAVPVWRKNAMYQDFSRCSIGIGPPNAPTDSAAYLVMRSGC